MSGMPPAQPDIMLKLDADGSIRDITLSGAIGAEAVDAWRGRPWTETVDGAACGKVRRMMDDARQNGVSGYSRFNQRFPSGLEIPVEFTTVRLGEQDGLVAIGRSLEALAEVQSRLVAAQQAMEQDYWKLRELETRYRMLFDSVRDPVVLLRSDTLRIADANPAALRALGLGRGGELLGDLSSADRQSFMALLGRVREHGRAPATLLHLGVEQQPWRVRATLMSSEHGPVYMLYLSPAGAPIVALEHDGPALEEMIERLPDAFVVMEENGRICHANRGFLELVQVGAKGAVEGQMLGRWLSHPGANLALLMSTLQRMGTVRRFPTVIYGELGTETPVEIAAAFGPMNGTRTVLLVVRDVGSGIVATPRAAIAGAAPQARTLIDLIGREPNKTLAEIVSDAVALVERQCISVALERSGGNRTSAANMLGISRQSLYKKVARYELDPAASAREGNDDDDE